MRIIKAGLENLEMVYELFDQYRQFYGQEPDIRSAEVFVSDRINKKESVIFLALDEKLNEAMGFVQLYPSFSSVSMQRIWILNDLFVHKDFRRKGVAEELIYRSKTLVSETKAKGILLETHKANSESQNLYDKTGFNRDEEHYYYFCQVNDPA